MALIAELVNVILSPLHIGLGEASAISAVGLVMTVTDAVVADVAPQLLLAVTVYMPALNEDVAKAVGF